jgi:hypothetical protein
MRPDKYICCDCGEIIPTKRALILKKDLDDHKPWSLPIERWLCLACQESREKRGDRVLPPDFAMATPGEGDDSTRITEFGWGDIPQQRRSRTINHRPELA